MQDRNSFREIGPRRPRWPPRGPIPKGAIREQLKRPFKGDLSRIRPKPILKIISPADVITLLNFACGIAAIMYSIQKGDGYRIAMILILMGIIFDGLDGPVARKFGSSHNFGIWLDSIADSVTFCIAPAFLVYNLFYPFNGSVFSSPLSTITVLSSFSIAILGILRLARFSLSNHRFKHFLGLPTPAMAMLVVSASSLYHWAVEMGIGVSYFSKGEPLFVPILLFLISFAMVSDIMYRKYRGRILVFTGLLVMGMIITLLLGPVDNAAGMTGSILFTAASVLYLITPVIHDPKNIWGASKRMEDEYLTEEASPIDGLIDDDERWVEHEIDEMF